MADDWEANNFNAKFPIGTKVWCWRGGAEVCETTVLDSAVFDEALRRCFVRLAGVESPVDTKHILPVTEWYRDDLKPVSLGEA